MVSIRLILAIEKGIKMHKVMTEFMVFGASAERAFERLGCSLGYEVYPYSLGFCGEFDLMIGGLLPVEVKAARPKLYWNGKKRCASWRWQFNITSLGANPGRDKDFLLVLACWVPAQEDFEFFLIPSAYLLGRPTWLQITSFPANYRGWMARFRSDWQAVDFLSARLRCEVNTSFIWGVK